MALKNTNKQKTRNLTKIIQKRSDRKPVSVWDFLPYKKFLVQRPNYLLLADDTYLEMMNLPGKDLDFLNADGFDGSNQTIIDFYALLSAYTPDFDILISQLPADTKLQQSAWGQRLNDIEAELMQPISDQRRTQLIAARNWATAEIQTDMNIVSQVTHQEYTLFLYGDTIKQLDERKQLFLSLSRSAFTPTTINVERKEMILRQINNPGERLELEDF
ncbi:hypothetical protein [Fructobacillus tropaeoli]|uniref:hypothetical protein n=1 Tax=Fructobacillus tropaeoli TaxID=709323 RepID=UPI002D8E65A6|nr:hypothetical protein LMG30238_FMBOGHMB_01593 [Fructobacillus tropaeoli]